MAVLTLCGWRAREGDKDRAETNCLNVKRIPTAVPLCRSSPVMSPTSGLGVCISCLWTPES